MAVHVVVFFLAVALAAAGGGGEAALVEHTFVVSQIMMHHLCNDTLVTVVNGQLLGPVLEVTEGDSVVVHVINQSPLGVTIHWHGVKQQLNCWADGPAMITQCPIQPNNNFTYRFNVVGQEGTLWWHAHAGSLRATMHGALIIRPRSGPDSYPFPRPDKEIPIVIASPSTAPPDIVYNLGTTVKATSFRRVRYNTTLEIVFQGPPGPFSFANPMHLHGHDFFIVAQGLGIYDAKKDVQTYNLVDPPAKNTASVPMFGWMAIRFVASNPGVWFLHCHVETHVLAGMAMVFVVDDGPTLDTTLPPPPADYPTCNDQGSRVAYE